MHKDVKPANILVDSQQGKVKLGDFGEASFLSSRRSVRSTMAGTRDYMPPEMDGISKQAWQRDYNYTSTPYSFPVDIYCLGASGYHLRFGRPPKKIDWERLKVSDGFKDFFLVCLNQNPDQRASARVLLAHPFIQAAKDSDMAGLCTKLEKIRKTTNSAVVPGYANISG